MLNMTHGEDPSPETHKDSAVLTYLEGLLMHPVEVGPGATASGRSEGVHRNQEQNDKARVVYQHHSHELTAPKAGTNGPTLGSSQHLKKARLLQSGAWSEPLSRPMDAPAADLNGQRDHSQNGSLEVSRNAGESTLLASLLQSFSSRLQSVAMSQQSSTPPSECSSPYKAPAADKESLQVYESAAGHLKGLMRKSRHNNHSSTPYSPRGHSQDRPPESPQAAHRTTPPSASTATESVSCADRLKAVANMVKIRSSPTASPKPSVACSQLALLLSSEAHFQQYSKVHALKAQFSGRCASERLAAIANQQHGQDKRPPSVGRTLSPIAAQTGLATETATTVVTPKDLRGSSSPSLMCGHSQSSSSNPPPTLNPHHGTPSREKRGFDSRPTRPPQTCSSLLLLLLNNHNSQKHLTKNGHLEDNCGLFPHSCSSSVTSDSECSHRDRSLAKDSSDGESSHSSCSPMDLSVRSRASTQDPGPNTTAPPSTISLSSSCAGMSSTPITLSSSAIVKTSPTFSPCSSSFSSVSTMISSSSSSSITSSLDKLTESLINKWKPEPSASKAWKDKEPDMRTDLKSPPKVTLMQLLLERRNTDPADKTTEDQDLPFSISKATNVQGQSNGLPPLKETGIKSPLDKPGAAAQTLYSFSQYPGSALPSFPYLSPHIQSSPLDLCKSKSISPEGPSQSTFSASKMLQNLAQSSSSSSPPILSNKGVSQDLDARRPLNLLESPGATIHSSSTTPLSDRPSSCGTPGLKEEFLPSQIENLLEKRTVLQLLLGAASGPSPAPHKSRFSSSGRSLDVPGGCYERSEGASLVCASSNQLPFGLKVKTETLQEDDQFSEIYQDSGRTEHGDYERSNSVPDFCHSVKKESLSTDNSTKYGLLSQLLKQQNAAYYSSPAPPPEPPARLLREGQHHVPSPKKRRLCCSPSNADDGDNRSNFYYSIQEEMKKQKNLKEEERKAPSERLSRESQGFNVLKQLLLSDNCLKELSQQAPGTPSPSVLLPNSKAPDRDFSQPAFEQGLPHQRSCHPHASPSSGQSHLHPPSISAGGPSVHLSHRQEPRAMVGQEPRTLVKQEPRALDRWTSQENDEKGTSEANLDSPQLSRSNPILYYMLQKGSIQLRKRVRDARGSQPESRIKEESMSDLHQYSPSLSRSPHTQTLGLKHSHESRGLS